MTQERSVRELATLLRLSSELDIVGDITATVDNPSELLAWATIVENPEILAWRAKDSGHRYVQMAALHETAPVRGLLTAILPADRHPEFWNQLGLTNLANGQCRNLTRADLANAWTEMPLDPPASIH